MVRSITKLGLALSVIALLLVPHNPLLAAIIGVAGLVISVYALRTTPRVSPKPEQMEETQ